MSQSQTGLPTGGTARLSAQTAPEDDAAQQAGAEGTPYRAGGIEEGGELGGYTMLARTAQQGRRSLFRR